MRRACQRCGRINCPAHKPRGGSTWQWRKRRQIILQRDGFRCQLRLPGCTGKATTVDHIKPKADGGGDEATNLVAACARCNVAKATSHLWVSLPPVARSPKAFKSAAHRAAAFINEPELARNIASKHGAKVGGGFTKAQLRRRRQAAGRGEPYRPKP